MENTRTLYKLHFLVSFVSLHVVIATANTLTHSNATLCHDRERSALLHFKNRFSLNKYASGDSSAYPKTESRKKSSSDCCSWYGVECDDNTGYVIGIHLNSSLFCGTLHSNNSIFSLVHLQTLNLADNLFLNSSVPPEISYLSSLSSLNLSFSDFSGQIPLELSGLSKLISIDLSRNNLYGDFPNNIFHLPDLLVSVRENQYLAGTLPEFNRTSCSKGLDLVYTSFSGNVPVSIGNLQTLTELKLGGCHLSGSISPSIGNLTQLTYLSLSYNMFKAGRPSWLDKLRKLKILVLDDTNLRGNIPPSLANMTQLTSLSLKKNHFEGEIPLWLMNMTHLTRLKLDIDELRGPIPSSISQLKNLDYLALGSNKFSGEVYADIFPSLKKLIFLSLSYNRLTLLTPHYINVTFPKFEVLQLSFCNLREIPYFSHFQNNLEVLFLTENNIHGKIPHWIWNASDHLEEIALSANFLTTIEHNPTVLSSMSLRVINLSDNMLQGKLPISPPNTVQYSVSNNSMTRNISPMICSVKSLKVLDFSRNNMSGPIPQCLVNSLEAFILQGNDLSGTIPQIYPEKCDLKGMDLSQNQLMGEVPKSLSNCKMLEILDLSYNQMDQTFPIWSGTLPRLQVLLLHFNKFYGEMGSPRIATEFPMLSSINLSHNLLAGDLPVNYIQIWNSMEVFHTDKELYMNTNVTFKTQHREWSVPYESSITLTNKGVKTEYSKILNIFTAIDLSSNKFTGQIPESFGILEALQLLDLSNNELTFSWEPKTS